MNIFMAFLKKLEAKKKVIDVVMSCENKQHLDGARKICNLYIKMFKLTKKEADKLWSYWNMKRLQVGRVDA